MIGRAATESDQRYAALILFDDEPYSPRPTDQFCH